MILNIYILSHYIKLNKTIFSLIVERKMNKYAWYEYNSMLYDYNDFTKLDN